MKITSIKRKVGSFRVFNFETSKHNNYYANNVLVHNCFAYFFKSNNPSNKGNEATLKSINADRLIKAIKGEGTNKGDQLMYEHFYKRKFLLHWGGMADPFCSFEKRHRVGLKLIDTLGELNYPTLFSYKGSGVFLPEYQKLFETYASQCNFAFQSSIITWDQDLAKHIEVGVPSPQRRMKSLKMFSDMGYWTILRLRPFIIGISDYRLDELLEAALAAGIRGISMEFFAMDSRANVGMKARYDYISKIIGVKNLQHYFGILSPKERGGYRRLNRLVKEMHVRKIYEFCAKHDLVCGISDPDFKELNTSGSCCAMPDHFPDNPGLENWTTSQLTYHLKEARKAYHTTGELRQLRFSEVYSNESYLDEPDLANDNVAVIGKSCAQRRSITQRDLVRERWNNLKSPANPRNYFHGKVMPYGLDDEGDYIYIYNPLEYEARWHAEGVDLTR